MVGRSYTRFRASCPRREFQEGYGAKCLAVSVMTENTAPVGSFRPAKRPTYGMSIAGTLTSPPSSTAFATVASQSGTLT